MGKQRTRTCTDPVPSNGGNTCAENDLETSGCNLGTCPRMCYCEHKNGATPQNGFRCGIIGESFTGPSENGYCSSNERCTGGTENDPTSTWVLFGNKGDLCD